MTMSGSLRGDIAARFHVSPQFVEAYFAKQNFGALQGIDNWPAFVATLDGLQRMYVEFAFTTTLRGRGVRDLLIPMFKGTQKSMRYLDIGCGYGGFLRAFSEAGMSATGIEILPHLAEFSRANTKDLNNTHIYCDDFLKLEFGSQRFSCITCNDVIEHIQDPLSALKRMANLLDEGGVLFLEIPNKDCIESVISDGHFQEFGITTLDRDTASVYFQTKTGRTDYPEMMGEYFPLEFYTSTFQDAGLIAQVLDRHIIGNIADAPKLLAEAAQLLHQWTERVQPTLPPLLSARLFTAVSRYISGAYSDLAVLRHHGGENAFRRKYLESFWTVIVTRPSTNLTIEALKTLQPAEGTIAASKSALRNFFKFN